MRLLLVLCAALAVLPQANAQAPGSPRWIVDRYLDPDGFPDLADYVDRELAFAHPSGGPEPASLGQMMRPGSELAVRPLHVSDTLAVYGVAATFEGETQDLYLYAAPAGDGWRLDALRSLALPGFVYELRAELEAREATLPDSLAAELGRLRLLMAPDAELRAFAQQHRAELDAIAGALLDRPGGTRIDADDADSALAARLRALHLSHATRRPDGSVDVLVGGILDNAVGFLWLPEGVPPPPMRPAETILAEPVGGGWVLYKTT